MHATNECHVTFIHSRFPAYPNHTEEFAFLESPNH